MCDGSLGETEKDILESLVPALRLDESLAQTIMQVMLIRMKDQTRFA